MEVVEEVRWSVVECSCTTTIDYTVWTQGELRERGMGVSERKQMQLNRTG